MTRRLITNGWLAGALVGATLAAAALATFSNDGVQVEMAGVEMNLKASTTSGLKVKFAAVGSHR
ncbi:MAG: hypothetical protein QNI84_09690 [Henriciella sp.]|nr:hypothetical protein [Henriciella sp.]